MMTVFTNELTGHVTELSCLSGQSSYCMSVIERVMQVFKIEQNWLKSYFLCFIHFCILLTIYYFINKFTDIFHIFVC